jgi:hypothetical protein
MLDLDKICSHTRVIPLKMPDGKSDNTVKITIRGNDHPDYRSAIRRAVLEQRQYYASMKTKGRGDDDPITEDDLIFKESSDMKMQVARVESIEGMSLKGKEIGTDTNLIVQALTSYGWLRDYIEEEGANTVGFCSV